MPGCPFADKSVTGAQLLVKLWKNEKPRILLEPPRPMRGLLKDLILESDAFRVVLLEPFFSGVPLTISGTEHSIASAPFASLVWHMLASWRHRAPFA